jgi:hypothetical protein
MKKLIPLILVVGLLVCSVPAMAGDGDVQFYAFKTISLAETFIYTENVAFTGTGLFRFDGEAWAKVQEQQELYDLHLQLDATATKRAQITTGSFEAASGIASVNQSPGNLNNQANETAFSAGQTGTELGTPAEPGTFKGMFCEAQVVSVQYNGILYDPKTDTRSDQYPNTIVTSHQTYTDLINGSFNGFAGIANVNQSAGSINNQGNAVAIAGGIDQVVVKAATDIMLAQNSAYNTMLEGGGGGFPGNATADQINNSFGNAFGVSSVNQAAGSMNNQKSAVTISFAGVAQP